MSVSTSGVRQLSFLIFIRYAASGVAGKLPDAGPRMS